MVFITGASSGLGQALAETYAQRGWRLALAARRVDRLRKWADAQGLGEDRCRCYRVDVSDAESVIQAARSCMADQGLPDVVIANAGISVGIDTAVREDLEVLADILGTNVLGLAATFHPFIEPMRQARRGTLVGVASVAAIRGLPGHAGYCASKAAVVAYCESLRVELRASGVRMVTLLPGFIDTPLTRRNPYPMPFLMKARDFAQQAVKTIDRGEPRKVIPWPMGVVAWLLQRLPCKAFDLLFAGRPRKPRRSEV